MRKSNVVCLNGLRASVVKFLYSFGGQVLFIGFGLAVELTTFASTNVKTKSLLSNNSKTQELVGSRVTPIYKKVGICLPCIFFSWQRSCAKRNLSHCQFPLHVYSVLFRYILTSAISYIVTAHA